MLIRSIKLIPVLFALWSLISCDKDVLEPTNKAVAGLMMAEIDGNSWKSDKSAAVLNNGYLKISALASDGSMIRLGVKGTAPAVYLTEDKPTNSSLVNKGVFVPKDWDLGNLWYSSKKPLINSVAGGTITLTEIDQEKKLVSGSFKLVMTRTKQNKDGSWPDPIQYEEVNIEGSFNKISIVEIPQNTASAKVNGSAFSPAEVSGIGGVLYEGVRLENENLNFGILVPDNVVPGTYDLDGIRNGWRKYEAFLIQREPVTDNGYCRNGSVTITKHNRLTDRIEGSFLFDAATSLQGEVKYEIREGTFAVTYPGL